MKQASVPRDNYITKIHQMWQTGELPRDVGFHQVSVCHDAWCGIWQQERCDCDPDIRLKFSLAGHGNN